jgi:Flp pilus assembly protein TadD
VATARRHLPLLERSVREEPDEPFHLYKLGVALGHLALHKEAETALRQAIELAPPRASWGAPALATLSTVVAAQERTAEAVYLCKAATKWAPDWARGWSLLGAALADAGRLKAALRAYGRALDCVGDTWLVEGDPDDTAWQVRAGIAKIHLVRGEYTEAAGRLRDAVALNPMNADLRVQLAHAYEAVGRPAEARRHLESAMMLAQAGPDAYAAFSDFFARRAEEALLRGLADNAENRGLLERIERLRAARAMA